MLEILENKLKEIRVSKSLTQEDLANLVSVSRQTIISIEKSVYEPSVKLAMKIAKVLGQSVEEIFSIKKIK
jgi:putative transcriptional regulator